MRIGDRVGVSPLMKAPWTHCEQIKTRGIDIAVAPTWPQEGQTIRVNMAEAASCFGRVSVLILSVDDRTIHSVKFPDNALRLRYDS
jgi:hypothetical protein